MLELERITARRNESGHTRRGVGQAAGGGLGRAGRVGDRRAGPTPTGRTGPSCAGAAAAFAPSAAWVAGRAVLLIPHRGETGDEASAAR